MRQQLTLVRSFTHNLPELMNTVAEGAFLDGIGVGASGPPFLGSHSISLRSKGFPPAGGVRVQSGLSKPQRKNSKHLADQRFLLH